MKLIILHTDDGETVGLNADHIVSFNAASSNNFPRTKTVIFFADSEGGMRVREPFAEIAALVRGTATTTQEAAERANLDERLATMEAALDEATFKGGQLAELATRVEALEKRIAELTDLTAQEQHTNDRHYEQQGDRIKQLEDGLRGLRRNVMGQEGRDYGERP